MERFFGRALILLAVFLFGCSPQSVAGDLEGRIDGLFTAYTVDQRPGYAIGVIRDGQLILAKGYGSADLAKNKPITPDTAFNLASLSKQFTAAAIALEIENGRLHLDDHLREHWNDVPEFMDKITLGHLVYMTSGLKEYYTLPSPKGGWASENEFTVGDAIDAVWGSGSLSFAPGTQWSYSNINYQVLAQLAGHLSKSSFSKHLSSSIFEPLGMSRSWIDAPIDQARDYRATSYVWDETINDWRTAPRLSPHYGGSGMFSTINDLAKWAVDLYGHSSLGDKFSHIMLSTRKYDHDKDNDAFGLVHGYYFGLKTIWYEGGDYGASTYMVHLPERNETVICLSNFGQGRCSEKTRAVMDVLLALHPESRVRE